MKTTKKNLLTVLGALAFMAVGAGAYNVSSVSASAEENVLPTISATTEVGFRLKGEYGLRFTTKTDASVCEMLTAENSGVTTGVLVIPTDLLKGELTFETPYVATGVTYDASEGINEWVVEEGAETAEAYAYLVDIPKMSYTRNLTVRSYYTLGGVPTYLESTTTSLSCVAQELLNLDAEDDSILTDEIAAIVAEYISDYTVVFKDELTNSVISRQSVAAEDGKVQEPIETPSVEGYVFNGWFVGDKEWDFENDVISGDTLITAKYTAIEYAPMSLDFSGYTVVPTFASTTNNQLTIADGMLTTAKKIWDKDSMAIAYDALDIRQGDKITITVTTIENGMNIDLNDEYYKWVGANSTATVTIEITKAMTLNKIAFRCSSSGGATYKIASIIIEQVPMAPLNLDFANYTEVPSFVKCDVDAKIINGTYVNDYYRLYEGKQMTISYRGVQLKAGDTITVKLRLIAGNLNFDINGEYKAYYSTTKNDGTNFAGGDPVEWTYTVTEDMVLNTIALRSTNKSPGSRYVVSSIVINKA